MIRLSDNDAATAVYDQVGEGGLLHVARRAGMGSFVPNPVWGGCQVTARDQARLFSRIRALLPERHRAYALGLLRNIVSYERWGIPHGSPGGWRLYFKGGWGSGTGRVDHQVALLVNGKTRVSVAVLTAADGTHAYGKETLRGIFARLLRGLHP